MKQITISNTTFPNIVRHLTTIGIDGYKADTLKERGFLTTSQRHKSEPGYMFHGDLDGSESATPRSQSLNLSSPHPTPVCSVAFLACNIDVYSFSATCSSIQRSLRFSDNFQFSFNFLLDSKSVYTLKCFPTLSSSLCYHSTLE